MKRNTPQDSLLGKESEYPSTYSPHLLFPIPRSDARVDLTIGEVLPFYGADHWTAFELSWLNGKGKPVVAVAEMMVPCESPYIIESKSLKLYLNSLNQIKFVSKQSLKDVIRSDLSSCAQTKVTVELHSAHTPMTWVNEDNEYFCIDDLDIEITYYRPDANLLKVNTQQPITEKLSSHLLKSNCPVTGQPDWASLFIDYSGPQIDRAGLLRYLISYREHMGFHEQCVEQIFMDIMRRCEPERLTVNARYLRRGGLDINPVRSTEKEFPIIRRQLRQ
ncbi:MAG: NADPH-dependent 7-cyano-7-deazaguanine reductase QueF [Pseudomonadales bacterium]|nr:NADPH-dependent 7-cyano-7-deazaguanine reductase QueF [Pseudomonadales bacterium]